MTDKALKIMKKKPKGFYLHIESGRIDHAHHIGNAYRALTETIALSDAVKTAVETLKASRQLENTLIIVTADHSHVFTIAGYPQRGNNILGKVIEPGGKGYKLASDGAPYTTLGYGNGKGYYPNAGLDNFDGLAPRSGRIENMAKVDTTNLNFHQEALVPLPSETHAGEDVAIYAMGPGAHLFQGTLEQNAVFHVMNKKMFKK